MERRFEAVGVDGRWFVMDHRYPADPLAAQDEDDAKATARIYNIFSQPESWEEEGQ